MYKLADLTREIEEIVAPLVAGGSRLNRDWIVQQVMAAHEDIDGEDSDFHRCVSRAKVQDHVRQHINRYQPKAEVAPDRQLILQGFERLQTHYAFEDGTIQVAIPIHEMTDAQIEAKEVELMAMGAGCYQHADELRRYRLQRRNVA